MPMMASALMPNEILRIVVACMGTPAPRVLIYRSRREFSRAEARIPSGG
jgi:hypothetical protein